MQKGDVYAELSPRGEDVVHLRCIKYLHRLLGATTVGNELFCLFGLDTLFFKQRKFTLSTESLFDGIIIIRTPPHRASERAE